MVEGDFAIQSKKCNKIILLSSPINLVTTFDVLPPMVELTWWRPNNLTYYCWATTRSLVNCGLDNDKRQKETGNSPFKYACQS